MSKLSKLVEQLKKELKESNPPSAVTPGDKQEFEISDAKKRVTETQFLRREWIEACISLARSQDWEPIEYKPGHTVVAGELGWRGFCYRANLTTLRDQVFPLLMRRVDASRPQDREGGQHAT